MAVQYVHMAERSWKFRGQFEEYYPEITQRICQHFGASSEDIASCFWVKKRTIEQWRELYPDFDEAIRNGRKNFDLDDGGWPTEYREWLHPYLAHAICVVFSATDEKIAHCFSISSETFAEWKAKYPALSAALRYGRKTVLFDQTLNQLRRIMESQLGARITSHDIQGILSEFKGVFDSLSVPAVSDYQVRYILNRIYRHIEDDFEKNKKDSPEQRENPAGRGEETEKQE